MIQAISSEMTKNTSVTKELTYSQIIETILRLSHQIFQQNRKELSTALHEEKKRYLHSTDQVATLQGRNGTFAIATSVASLALGNIGRIFPSLNSFQEIFSKTAEAMGQIAKSNNETKLQRSIGTKDLSLQEYQGVSQEKSSQESDEKTLSQIMEALTAHYRASTSR